MSSSVRQLRKLAKQNPKDARVWYDLGIALANERELDATRDALQHALSCGPSTADLANLIGISLEGLGHLERAADAFRCAGQLEPDQPEGHARLGAVLLRIGKAKLALEPLRNAVKRSDFSSDSCYRYAVALEQTGDIEESLAFSHIAGFKDPESPEIHRMLGRLLGRAGHVAGAIRAWKRVVSISPSDATALTALGIVLSTWGNHADAVKNLAEVARLRPDSAEAFSDLAMALSRAGSHDSALRAMKQAVNLKPRSPQVQLNLGVTLMTAGQHEAAMGVFHEVASLAPNWSLAHFNLAMALSALGDLPAARDALVKASTLDSSDVSIQEALRHTVLTLSLGSSPKAVHTSSESGALSSTGSGEERALELADAPSDPKRAARPRYLTGELNMFPVIEVLEFLKVRGSSGVLEIRSKSGKGALRLKRGDLVGAASPVTPSLFDILISMNAITHDDAEITVGEVAGQEDAARLGLFLVEDGIIKKETLEQALWTQVSGALMELIPWEDGDFSFHAEESTKSGVASPTETIAIDMRFALMEVLRRIDESKRG